MVNKTGPRVDRFSRNGRNMGKPERIHWCGLDSHCRENYSPNRLYLRFFEREILIDFQWAWWPQPEWDKWEEVEVVRKRKP